MLFLYAQNHAQSHTKQSREKHLQSAWQQEGYRVRRIPKQRYRLGEDEAILRVPVDFLAHRLPDLQRFGKESFQRSSRLRNMDVGNFVERHENRRKQCVHQHADAQRDEELAPTEIADKPCRGLSAEMETAVQQGHGTRLEDGHGRGNDHAQHSPNQHLRQKAEAFLKVHAFANAQGQHLAKSAKNGKLEEAHQQAMVFGGRVEPIPRPRDESEAANHGGHDKQGDEICFSHIFHLIESQFVLLNFLFLRDKVQMAGDKESGFHSHL